MLRTKLFVDLIYVIVCKVVLQRQSRVREPKTDLLNESWFNIPVDRKYRYTSLVVVQQAFRVEQIDERILPLTGRLFFFPKRSFARRRPEE